MLPAINPSFCNSLPNKIFFYFLCLGSSTNIKLTKIFFMHNQDFQILMLKKWCICKRISPVIFNIDPKFFFGWRIHLWYFKLKKKLFISDIALMNNLTLKYSKNLKPWHLQNTSPPSISNRSEKNFFQIIEELFLYKSYYRVFFYNEFLLNDQT